MKVAVFVKATPSSEAGLTPDESTQALFAEMGRYNEALVEAGIMKDAAGLHPSAKGVRVRFRGKERIVTDGPFAETKELVAGYWCVRPVCRTSSHPPTHTRGGPPARCKQPLRVQTASI